MFVQLMLYIRKYVDLFFVYVCVCNVPDFVLTELFGSIHFQYRLRTQCTNGRRDPLFIFRLFSLS